MAHHHHHSDNNGLTTAFWLNAGFTIIEVIGGILTNSTAILTDAVHDFGDTLAIGSGILLEKFSSKKRSKTFSYGYKRFSLLSAIFLYIFLLCGSFFMLFKAVTSFNNPQVVNSSGMFWLAILGIVINGAAFLKVKTAGKGKNNQNSKAILFHLLEDVLGWIAILVGAVIIYFTNWFWIDPLLSVLIALFIIYNATKHLLHTMKIVLQAVPENINTDEIQKAILELKGVKEVHDFHVWSLDGDYTVGTVHIVVEDEHLVLGNNIRKEVEIIMDKFNINHPTLQLETFTNNCRFATC